MHGATLLLIILAAGMASQWVAWRIRIPAIVIMIGAGLTLGPVAGIIRIDLPQRELTDLIGLGVAIILFEGGMDLKFGEFRRVGRGIGRLTVLCPPLAWLFGALAARHVAGLSWPVACVLGAILVVTGPTVIQPLLRQSRLRKKSTLLLKWESIVNDPIGVLFAVLTFQYFTTVGGGWGDTLVRIGVALVVAAVLGGLGGWLIAGLYRRGLVPEHLKPPALMLLVLLVYAISNMFQHEAGLLSVTVMGLVIGNVRLVERNALQRFKENLTVILLAILFIVIPSQLEVRHLQMLDWRSVLFVLAILLIVRPASIALATIGAPIQREDKLLLAWVAPRGIVAAATAGILGPELVAAGFPDAQRLLPIMFLVIISTVLLHGLTIGGLARRLGLAAAAQNGLLIVGASPWARALASALHDLGINVMLADGALPRLMAARVDGVEVYFGEVLSEHAEHSLETQHLSYLLCATDNDFYNALVCKARGRGFGLHRTFQLAIHQEIGPELHRVPVQQRGHTAFDERATFEALHQYLDAGWTIRAVGLRQKDDFALLSESLGVAGRDWFLLGGVSPSGQFRLYSRELAFNPDAGWTLLIFAPERAPRAQG
ncbi:CPA1 family monovalent cation:H+ antiporter [Desulfobaculum xiamenense]|uniref:CPA1 family monovalent cation:H+ antiporter n=1 Tax=Desulfobaculum xiamenense TaxID=995050 RepID=A0A846QDP5_9BACT|nr:sodium:proton antiporter [Desulfobaculum xiamenense]NJB66846.1 CPA1 family monovalent cation:H+ antiporter [Desulfobaculum xiamenense]